MLKIFCLAALFAFTPAIGFAEDGLKQAIMRIIADKSADVGVSIDDLENSQRLTVNNDRRYPMQSVFKFHLALAVLHHVDLGTMALDQLVPVTQKDLLPDTWSPLREVYPHGTRDLSLADLLRYTVAQSDNNGCDILLRLIGGPQVVNDYIAGLGIRDMAIVHNEREMHADAAAQFANWSAPQAATDLLRAFYTQDILSTASFAFLWRTMLDTKTGLQQIKALLPPKTPVAHKTGSSGVNAQGMTMALNDMGIVTLPNGHHVAIAVFITRSRENQATNERIIAQIAKAAWDHLGGQPEVRR